MVYIGVETSSRFMSIGRVNLQAAGDQEVPFGARVSSDRLFAGMVRRERSFESPSELPARSGYLPQWLLGNVLRDLITIATKDNLTYRRNPFKKFPRSRPIHSQLWAALSWRCYWILSRTTAIQFSPQFSTFLTPYFELLPSVVMYPRSPKSESYSRAGIEY
jgi:hypothetical protein